MKEAEEEKQNTLTEIEQTMLNSSIDQEAFKFLLRNQAYEALAVDYDRNNAYALFQIRQRENYIKYLKESILNQYFYIKEFF